MENKEHNLQDKRCECCGYMTYQREHMSCIRAARQAIDAAEQAQQAEPVAWLKYPRKKPELMQVSLSKHLPVALKNSGWVSEPLYTQPPAVAVPKEAADSIRSPYNACCNKEHCRAMLAAAPQAAAEGCGACGDGCKGQGCRLERESPPTCQTCNGQGMVGGLLPNGGGYDGEPRPDCTAPKPTAEDSSVVVDAVVVPTIKLGLYGRAFDTPQTRRAYTYREQPDNIGAYKLGRAVLRAASGGDSIDYGLSLLKELQAHGFGVFELGDQQEGGQQ